MSKTYATVSSDRRRGIVTKCGDNQIMASVQSYDGSVIVELTYDDDDVLNVRLGTSDDTTHYMDDVWFRGTFEDFKKAMNKLKKQ